jgi:class 3 adenylate cyclase
VTNVHHVLPSIQAPTLVLHRRGDRQVRVQHGRYLAEHIPDATYRELDGDDNLFFAGDTDALVDEIEEFLTGVRPPVTTNRVLATVCFTDIVGSSERASERGRPALAHPPGRSRRGRTEPTRALQRARSQHHRGRVRGHLRRARSGHPLCRRGPAALRPLGVEIRAGLHTGEVQLRDTDIGGIAVHTAARVQALAEPGEVLVSRTVVDLMAGSGIDFADRGEHELKGVPGAWRLFSVTSS